MLNAHPPAQVTRGKTWFNRRALVVSQRKLVKQSKFQAIGWFFTATDQIASGTYLDQLNALYWFDREIGQLELGYYAPIHLLCSATWDERLLAAWCLIGGAERQLARKQISNGEHNFWPSTRFTDDDWDEHVQAWLAIQPSLKPESEFQIAIFVGTAARDPIVFNP